MRTVFRKNGYILDQDYGVLLPEEEYKKFIVKLKGCGDV